MGNNSNKTPAVPLLNWLCADGRRAADLQALLDEFCRRANLAGLSVARAALHIQTLHPLVLGHSHTWERQIPATREVNWKHGAREEPVYTQSPLRVVFEDGKVVRRQLDIKTPIMDFPILEDLRAKGMTDYIIIPLNAIGNLRNAVSFATDRPGGFTASDLTAIDAVIPVLSLVVELLSAARIARTLLDTYVGRSAGRRVLDGTIRRGSGEIINAIIWFCDMRDSTSLSESLTSERMIATLNEFFETMAEPVQRHGGEILKFIGDGFLAIFRADADGVAPSSCHAYAAAREANAAMAALNAARTARGDDAIGHGLSLHVGPVMYGNIGAPDRLDFTVIGPAVNFAARLEQLTKSLGEILIMSAEFAAICPMPKRALGHHALRGLAEPAAVFGVPEELTML
ncbi:MAG: adenylate/guanylate cyclase domain-containing protein [Alphaproteobacteria bacterium]